MNSLRVSSYIIPVKLENETEKYILIHGYTGAIDIIEEKYWNELKNFPENNRFTSETLQLLQNRGYLTTKTEHEEYEYVAQLAQLLHRKQSKLHKSFGFLVTYNYNFRCPYCFESNISNHGCNWSKKVLTKELVDKAYDAMLKIEPYKQLHNKDILLYGGEPFLKENKEIISYIIQKGSNLGYIFKVITNGYDLDEFEDILSPNYFKSFQITLDGYNINHDKRRKHYLVGNSFNKIIANIAILLKHNIVLTIRVNIDKKTIMI